MKRHSLITVSALGLLCSATAACGTQPLFLAAPCINEKAQPLGTPTFSQVTVSARPLPASPSADYVAANHGDPAKLLADNTQQALRALPYFSQGPGPALTIEVTVSEESYWRTHGAWLIPTVLFLPGWGLLGGPTGGRTVHQDITFEVKAGDFHRRYRYTIQNAWTGHLIYYTGPKEPAYYGHMLWALSQDLQRDYRAFADGGPASPEPLARTLDVQGNDAFYDPIEDCEPNHGVAE